jgi:hypothetical protein
VDQSLLPQHVRAARVLREEALFPELFALAFDDEPARGVQALAEIDEVTRTRPDLVVPHRGELLARLDRLHEPDAQRLTALILARVKLSPKERAAAAPVFERWLDSPSAATVMAALAALVDLAGEDGRLRRALVPRIERRMLGWTPALRARAERVLARLAPRTIRR